MYHKRRVETTRNAISFRQSTTCNEAIVEVEKSKKKCDTY